MVKKYTSVEQIDAALQAKTINRGLAKILKKGLSGEKYVKNKRFNYNNMLKGVPRCTEYNPTRCYFDIAKAGYKFGECGANEECKQKWSRKLDNARINIKNSYIKYHDEIKRVYASKMKKYQLKLSGSDLGSFIEASYAGSNRDFHGYKAKKKYPKKS